MTPAETIYLDHNATTRPLPEVIEVVALHAMDSFANPGSRHRPGRRARQVLESARESIATLLGADPDEVVFTSGGTESNNLALFGLAQGPPARIATTAGEHPSVREPCRFLEGKGWSQTFLPVDAEGRLTSAAGDLVAEARLASILLAHNETGVVQEVGPIAEICRDRRIPLHLDAVQAVGRILVDFHALGSATLALGAHKFHGPRGIGALLVRRGTRLIPSLHGGHQETERRAGTEPVPLIAGMAKALEICHAEMAERQNQVRSLRDHLERRLSESCPPVLLNGARDARLPNTLNLTFPGVPGEALLVALDLEGIACSLGSTCASGSAEPAPVLLAMGRSEEIARSSIRFSLGRDNTPDEIARAAQIIARTVKRLRECP